jgi:hypothetical protein
MPKHHLPSVEALTSNDEERLAAELRLSEVRAQVELARSLVDQLEVGAGDAEHDGVAEELARLGCRLVEVASDLATRARRTAAIRSVY